MRFLTFLSVIFFTHQLQSQSLSPIQLDRPDQTECPFITPTGYLQLENGFTIQNFRDRTEFFYPQNLTKFGVNSNLELRLITDISQQRYHDVQSSRFSNPQVGFKTRLFQEKGLIPQTSFIGHVTLQDTILPKFRFTSSHTISKRSSLSYNWGIEWQQSHNWQFIWTLAYGHSITNQLSAYFEFYGFSNRNNLPDLRYDGGFTYLIGNDLMLDLSASRRITSSEFLNYYSLGVSWRFKV